MLYFNPHLPCGRRRASNGISQYSPSFQSTPSLRKATMTFEQLTKQFLILWHHGSKWLCQFQSTPSLRKATPFVVNPFLVCRISIHTFLAEGDSEKLISAGADGEFQSTPSLRKATRVGIMNHMRRKFQSTPSLRKATRRGWHNVMSLIFQSTPSLRKATRKHFC
ncbi:uncharacterized protein BN544_04753 [Hungatella hathewayi CAG:224]|nr:uncharacterized protein BN544_04753 [Hungatella hathewayi CAG:224]